MRQTIVAIVRFCLWNAYEHIGTVGPSTCSMPQTVATLQQAAIALARKQAATDETA